MIDSAELMRIMLANTVGLSILAETIRMAGYLFTHTNGNSNRETKEAKSCFAFIRGTGLELLIEDYELGYNADQLRYCFFDYFKQRKYID